MRGFYHVDGMKEQSSRQWQSILSRDYDKTKFEERKAIFQKTAETLNQKYGAGTFEVKSRDSYS